MPLRNTLPVFYLCPMGWKSVLMLPFAKYIANDVKRWSSKPFEAQQRIFDMLIREGSKTAFGKEHGLNEVKDHKAFAKRIPVRDYEQLKPYIQRVIDGERDVLWKGKPAYFAKTSGTTSGTKYIPLTKDSIPNHMNSARNALMCYVAEANDASVFDGKLIFVSGSPELDRKGDILTGRLSGIVNHHVPSYVKTNQLPTYQTNTIEDWETKLDKIVEETVHEDMRLISGIPPWVLMYYERLIEKTGKPIKDIFPHFKVFVHGGVNFKPYAAKLEHAVGKKIPIIETYPASEGFIAYKDSQYAEGLLLNIYSGIFFEFIPLSEVHSENPVRLTLQEVELDKNYAVIINNNAGLWGYSIGDTIKFVSKDPYRIEVTGRIKHYISAFGEHVIADEVEQSLLKVAGDEGADIVEFHVAPQVNPSQGLPYHEWFVEFGRMPQDLERFRTKVDEQLQQRNIYYQDLISGNILQPLKLNIMRQGAFREYMKSKGKLGGQNKVPRLSNNRELAEDLERFVV